MRKILKSPVEKIVKDIKRATRKQYSAAAANRLMLERRLDPCMSEVFSWNELPEAHMKMMRNEHKPGNMSVLVQAPKTGLRTLEDCLDANN